MTQHGSLTLVAPLSGILVPLDRVPDPVFSQRMVGDGLAIDPLDGVLCAPCSGTVTMLHAAGHAVTLRTDAGVEILMHVGLDTVNLKGQGFTPRVKTGDRVAAGAPLIQFDLDYVATHAKSLLTMVVVTNMEQVASIAPASGTVVVGRDTVLTIALRSTAAVVAAGGPQVSSEPVSVPNPTGLHARPAAVLAAAAKAFQSEVRLTLDGRTANAKSVTSVMSLDVRQGSAVTVVANGADAAEAVAKVAELLRQGAGDEVSTAPAVAAVVTAAKPVEADLIRGVVASPGLGVGTAFRVRHAAIAVAEHAADPSHERTRLADAIARAKAQLVALQSQLQAGSDPDKAAIFAAHAELLDDPDLMDVAEASIADGRSAGFAWQSAYQAQAARLAGMSNALLAQRAGDVRDVGERVLELLSGVERNRQTYPAGAVLVAEDLTPSDTAALDPRQVAGFCTTRGGATSHVAILARSLGIPALAGVDPRVLDVPDGTPVILDGTRGVLRLNPSAAEMDALRGQQQTSDAKRQTDLAHASEPATTLDGHRLEIVANIGDLRDARQIVGQGGEGVGLLRSEFLFMDRGAAPTEQEQFEAYKLVAEAIGPTRPLIIRTLDVGGDKPLSYLPIPPEENPFLGQRGIRISLDRPDVLRIQIRAALRAAAFGQVRIMFPMVTTVTELREAKAIVADEAAKLGVPVVPVGIMVEVPAVAVMAPQFAKDADFFSVGTNDLTQYTLAMDRGHPQLAPHVDGLNPAVLRLIERAVAGAHAKGKWVGVCGGIAGDAAAVPLLVGLGVDELSVSIPAIPAVKAQVRSLRLATCQKLAADALECDTAAEVRALVAQFESSQTV